MRGLAWGGKLVRVGCQLTDHNREAAKGEQRVAEGGRLAGSPAEVAERSDVGVTMVTDSPDVEAVVGGERGLLGGATAGSAWIDMSTISPAVTRRLAAAAAELGVESLDAPVSGGPPGAEAGTLSIM